jgi:uncharacterized protein (DUF2147 family)
VKFKGFISKAAFVAAGVTTMLFAAGAAQAAAVEGTWRALNGSEITIAPCGAGEYCGSLSYIVIPKAQADMCRSMAKDAFASLILDYNNAEKAMQTRPLLGVEMVRLKPTNEPEGYSAKIYNAEDGKYYDVLIWIMNGNTLRLGGGCIGSLCAVTQDWPKVSERETVPDFTCDGGL